MLPLPNKPNMNISGSIRSDISVKCRQTQPMLQCEQIQIIIDNQHVDLPHSAAYLSFCLTSRKSRIKKIYDTTNKETVDVKWRELDFSLLLSSALKCMYTADRGNPQCLFRGLHIAGCRRQKYAFESELPQA
jgi:hypothetical protein